MANLINNVFAAARTEQKSQGLSVDAIKAAIVAWSDKDNVKLVQVAYQSGRLCASLGLANQKQAEAIFALKPHKDGAGDDTRTLAQHLACRAAISAWSNIRMRAGAPNARDAGKGRSTRTSTANAAPETAPTVAPVGFEPAIVKATSVADVHAYALRVASNMLKYLNASPEFVVGEVGDLLRHFPVDVRKAVKASKPAKIKAEA